MNEPGSATMMERPGLFLTTAEAARRLGVSVGTVLNMVQRGELSAWRTEGGHRRVDASSVDRRLLLRASARPPGSVRTRLEVLVIEDDEFVLELYRDHFDEWQLPINVRFARDGVEGLVEVGRLMPDVLLVDLHMPNVDGFSVVRTLRNRAEYDRMDLIVVSGLSAERIAAAGGLPDRVAFWPKPVPFPKLHGFLEARVMAAEVSERS